MYHAAVGQEPSDEVVAVLTARTGHDRRGYGL
jgi:hypothetical protein